MSEILGTLFKYLMMLLGVAAVVLIFYAVTAGSKTSNAVSNITQTVANVQAMYSGTSNFGSLNNLATTSPAQIAPSAMLNGNSMIDPWGGTINIIVDPANSSRFDVVLNGPIPDRACTTISTSVPAEAITISGSAVAFPIDAGQVAVLCKGNANTLTMVFGK